MSKEWKQLLIYFIVLILISVATVITAAFDHSSEGRLTLIVFVISLVIIGIPTAIWLDKIIKEKKRGN
jgi:Na+-driven multidrug efflux pump